MASSTRSLWGPKTADIVSGLEPLREWLLERWCADHKHFQLYHRGKECFNEDEHPFFDTSIEGAARCGALQEEALQDWELPADVVEGLWLLNSMEAEVRNEFHYSTLRALPWLGDAVAFGRGVNGQLQWLGFSGKAVRDIIQVAGASHAMQAVEYGGDLCPYVEGDWRLVDYLFSRPDGFHLQAEDTVHCLRKLGLPVPNVGSSRALYKVLNGAHTAIVRTDNGLQGYNYAGRVECAVYSDEAVAVNQSESC